MASTRRPPMDSVPMIVCTHSYRMAFPALRAPSVLVATCPVSHHMRHAPGTCARLAAPLRGTWRAQGDAKDLACACDASPNNAARCSEPTPMPVRAAADRQRHG